MPQQPIRPKEHVLEELSYRFLQSHIPAEWTIEPPSHDYGVDCIIKIFERNFATPYELHVQLKSSSARTESEVEKVRLNLSTYNHLMGLLHVTMLITFVEEENEAYWIFLAKLPAPNQHNKTFTVNIPKTNRLSQINWANIQNYITRIVDKKLSVGDVFRNDLLTEYGF